MGVNEGSLQVIDRDNIHGTYLPVALLVVFVIQTKSYICDSTMSKR